MSQKGFRPWFESCRQIYTYIWWGGNLCKLRAEAEVRTSSDPTNPTSRLGQSGAAHPVDVTKWVFDLDKVTDQLDVPMNRGLEAVEATGYIPSEFALHTDLNGFTHEKHGFDQLGVEERVSQADFLNVHKILDACELRSFKCLLSKFSSTEYMSLFGSLS